MHDGAAIPSPDGDRRAVRLPGGSLPGGSLPGASLPAGSLTTERLLLSPVAAADLEELFRLHADPRTFVEDLTEPLTDRTQMRWVLEQWLRCWQEHGLGYRTVRTRPTGTADDAPRIGDPAPADAPRGGLDAATTGASGLGPAEPGRAGPLPPGLLGVVGLAPLPEAGPEALSAYWRLAPEVTGRGVAHEAMAAVLARPGLTVPGGGYAGPGESGMAVGPGGEAGGAGGEAGGAGGSTDAAAPGTADHAVREVIAVTAARNLPSRALAARLGFVPAPADRPVPGGRPGDVLLLGRASLD